MISSTKFATTVRFNDEDREILAKLSALTGIESVTGVLKLAMREALATRVAAKRASRKAGV